MTLARRGVTTQKMHPQWRPNDRGHLAIQIYFMMRRLAGRCEFI
jgi:hypothetical protein